MEANVVLMFHTAVNQSVKTFYVYFATKLNVFNKRCFYKLIILLLYCIIWLGTDVELVYKNIKHNPT